MEKKKRFQKCFINLLKLMVGSLKPARRRQRQQSNRVTNMMGGVAMTAIRLFPLVSLDHLQDTKAKKGQLQEERV